LKIGGLPYIHNFLCTAMSLLPQGLFFWKSHQVVSSFFSLFLFPSSSAVAPA